MSNSQPKPARPSWRMFLDRLSAFEEAMSMTHDDIQDRRLASLEREVASLRSMLVQDFKRTPSGD